VRFSVLLHPEPVAGGAPLSLAVNAGLCRDCRRCLAACPTGALRVRAGVPQVDRPPLHRLHLLHRGLRAGALGLAETAPDAERLGAVRWRCRRPPAGFGERVTADCVRDALADSGFAEVCSVDGCETALRAEVAADARQATAAACTFARLPVGRGPDRLRFPSLLAHLGAVRLALGVSRHDDRQRHRLCRVVPGSAQRAGRSRHRRPPARSTRPAARPRAGASRRPPQRSAGTDRHDRRRRRAATRDRHRSCHRRARTDRRRAADRPAAIELYVCDGGCFGSPLLADDPFSPRPGRPPPRRSANTSPPPAVAAPRQAFAARPGIRLDARHGQSHREARPPRRATARAARQGLRCVRRTTCAALARTSSSAAPRSSCARTVPPTEADRR